MMKAIFLSAWISIGVVAYGAQSKEQADVEKGRVALGQACVQCHNLRGIQSQRKTQQQWRDTVYSMIGRGGMILPDEIEPITAYLTANYGPNSPRPSEGTAQQQLPASEGRAILQRSCTQCHDLQTAIGKTASRQEWNDIIARMVSGGASITPSEQQTLIQYLTTLVR
jgi:mono/diheme cytochrome c family protein